MPIKAVCPKDGRHDLFVTTAHVVEEWIVDRNGNYIDLFDTLETVHGPAEGNIWACHICGTQAIVGHVSEEATS